jgi:RNA polymerase sigma-70 factor (ECF subfamily)
VRCDRARFATHISGCVSRGATAGEIHAHIAELYLICACTGANRMAAAILERDLMPDVARTIARVDSSPMFVNDVEKQVRDQLFAGIDEGRSDLAGYIGRVPLAAWVRVYALRRALARTTEPSLSHGLLDDDPELRRIAGHDRARLTASIRDAVARLHMRERSVLRMNQIDRLSIDEIARLYRVHRATAMMWLDAAKRAVRSHVIAELGVESTEAPRAARVRPSAALLWQFALTSTVVAR